MKVLFHFKIRNTFRIICMEEDDLRNSKEFFKEGEFINSFLSL